MGFCNVAIYCCLILLTGCDAALHPLYLQAHRLTPPRCTACIYLSLEYSSRNQDCASCLLSICCVAAGRRKHREEAQQLWTPGFCRQDNNKVRGRGALHTHLHPGQSKEQSRGPHLLFCLARHALPVPAPWQCITATPGARGSFLGLMIVLCACLLLPGLSTPFFGQKLQHKL